MKYLNIPLITLAQDILIVMMTNDYMKINRIMEKNDARCRTLNVYPVSKELAANVRLNGRFFTRSSTYWHLIMVPLPFCSMRTFYTNVKRNPKRLQIFFFKAVE